MEPEGSLPHSQEPATCPYPETYQSNHALPSYFLKIHFSIILLPTCNNPTSVISHKNPNKNFIICYTEGSIMAG
jgi:hypothetical protein